MDYPPTTPCPELAQRRRQVVSPWLPAAIVAAVLVVTSVAACMIPDTRDVAERQGSVLRSRAL